MGFEIDKFAAELKQSTSHIIQNEQAVGEQGTASLTNAENENLTFSLSGEAQSKGFTEKDAEELTNNLSGSSSADNSSTTFLQEKNLHNADTSENFISFNLQLLINKYPNIAKVLIREGAVTFADENNNIIRDTGDKPITIAFNNGSSVNLLTSLLKNASGEVSTVQLLQLAVLQEKINSKETFDKFLAELINQNKYPENKSMKREELNEFIASFLCEKFLNNGLSPELKKILDINEPEEAQNKVQIDILSYDRKKTTKELTPIEFRAKINDTNNINKLKKLKKIIEEMPYSKAEKQMLNNEYIKRLGVIQNNKDTEIQYDKEVFKSDFREEGVKSRVAFNLYKNCKSPIQRELANIILCDRRLYMVKSSHILEKLTNRCETETDLKIIKQLLEKALQNTYFNNNNVLSESILYSISNTTTKTYELQLKLIEEINTENNTEIVNHSIQNLIEHPFKEDSPETLEFCKKIIFNNNLIKNEKVLDTLSLILKSKNIGKDALNFLYGIAQTDISKYTAEELLSAANYVNKDSSKEFIETYIKSGFNADKIKSKDEEILSSLLNEDAEIYKKIIDGRNFSRDHLFDLFRQSQYSGGKEILANIAEQNQYSAENIIDILKYTSEKTSYVTKQVLEKRNITVNEKVYVLYSINNNYSQISLIKEILNNDDINIKCLPEILTSIKTLNNHNIRDNEKNIDPRKIERYIALLQNPKTSHWVAEMLNSGWDIETISKLNQTKLKYYANTEEKDPDRKFFTDLGFNGEETDNIIEAITNNGIINNEMKQAAIGLLRSGIPKHRIGGVLKFAMTTGEYNSKITADAMVISNLGVNSFLERFLPIANNLSLENLSKTLSPDIRKLLMVMINQLPASKKPALKAEGFDLDGIMTNLQALDSGNEYNLSVFNSNLAKSEFKKYITDKYKPSDEILQSDSAANNWAELKVDDIKNNYSTKPNSFDTKRSSILKTWFDFMETDSEIKNNTFAKLVLSEYITRDLNNKHAMPPEFSKSLAASILNSVINNKEKYPRTEMILNKRKMSWHTFGQSDNSKESSDKLKQLSESTGWNTKQTGNIHILVDEGNKAQVYIREENGIITEIQKRNKDGSVPVAYIDFINEFISQKGLSGYEEKINSANNDKPAFEDTKTELQTLAENKNYKAILEKMGIEVKTMPDGTWEISHYTSFMNNLTLNEYGINETELLSNVSRITGDADLRDSNATSLHNLKNVGGNILFGNNEFNDLNSLEEINKKKIPWELS